MFTKNLNAQVPLSSSIHFRFVFDTQSFTAKPNLVQKNVICTCRQFVEIFEILSLNDIPTFFSINRFQK